MQVLIRVITMAVCMPAMLWAVEAPEVFAPSSQPAARVVQDEVQTAIAHTLVIGSVRRINNQLRIERSVQARGDLQQLTREWPSDHSAADLFLQVKAEIQRYPHSMLYFCEGRECGSSSIWANQIFDYSRLYGPDEGQFYAAFRLDTEPQQFVSLYAVTRGNRRVYMHLEQFTPAETVTDVLLPTPATLLKQIETEGHILIPASDLQSADEGLRSGWSELIGRMLGTDRRLRVELEGEQNETFYAALIDQGVRAERLRLSTNASTQQVLVRKIP